MPPIQVPLKGDNSFQRLDMEKVNVKQILLNLERSGAVTDITFCYPTPTSAPTIVPAKPMPGPESPGASPSKAPSESLSEAPTTGPEQEAPSASPSESPGESPTESPGEVPTPGSGQEAPSASPSESPSEPPSEAPSISPSQGGMCINTTITFDTLPDGSPTKGGAYVDTEWYDVYGIKLLTSGGLKDIPHLFNTSDVGTDPEFGDRDLGSPNEKCPTPGPGEGLGGEPFQPGENCVPQGNVLNIQEDNERAEERPNDNRYGSTITMKFSSHVTVYELGVMDIEQNDSFVEVISSGVKKQINIVGLGDNALQTIDVNTEKVSEMTLNLATSGAITHISFVLVYCMLVSTSVIRKRKCKETHACTCTVSP